MRILHVINWLGTGGAEAMLCKLVEAGVRAGDEHRIVTLQDGGGLFEVPARSGVEVRSLGIEGTFSGLAALPGLRRIIREAKPDVVQGWLYHGSIAAWLGVMNTRHALPLLMGVRGSIDDLSLEKAGTRLAIRTGAYIARRASAVLYVSHTGARQHEALGYPRGKSVVIPNGFDCDLYRPDSAARPRLLQSLDLPPTRLLVGMVARAHPMKDHASGFAAVGTLVAEGHDVRLIVAGRGADPGNTDLVELAASSGLADRVAFLGEHGSVSALMPAFDVLLLSSAWGEGFPNVLGEAMACGVPCVTTDVGDSRAIVGDTGFVVPPRQMEGLAAALREIIALGPERRKRLGSAARSRILKKFALEPVAAQYRALYLDLAKARLRPDAGVASARRYHI